MLLTKFGKYPTKHVEEEAIIVRRKKELDLETDLDTVAWYLLAEVTPSWPWPHEWNWGSQAYVFI